MGIIKAEAIEKQYGYGHSTLRVLKKLSVEIRSGEIVSIVGPSGAGKSTLLNLFGCLDRFQEGRLTIVDKDVTEMSVEDLSGFRNRNIGFIFQLHNLLFDFTALENVMIPLLIRRVHRKQAREQAETILERFDLADRINHKPAELSGGECQRVAVARAIIGKPRIILADEPTGSLDTENSQLLANVLFELGRENESTIVLVTHDLKLASQAQRTISLIDGEIVSDQIANPVE